MKNPWLVVNRQGLADTLSETDRFRIICELIQNALDTSAKKVIVLLDEPYYGYAKISVEDNDSIGFEKLEHAYEMFASTSKRKDHTKAGRFTIGEKRFLALCRKASIESTNGGVLFEINNGQENRRRINKKRDAGTLVRAEIEMTQEQYGFICASIWNIIPHDGVELIFNGTIIQHRKPVITFKAMLQTEMANPETNKMQRKLMETEVRLYEPLPNETPCLYELGIPVVEIDCRWHIDVRQRVPLNTERDNVPPKFKSTLLALVANHGHDALSESDASKDWVRIAMGDKHIEQTAFEDLKTKAFGEKTLIANPLDPESINRGTAEGYNVIFPRSLTEGQRENNKRFGTMLVSSAVFPTPKPYSDDPNAPPVEVVDRADWTDGMKMIHDLTKALASRLLGTELTLRFVNTSNGFSACFGKGFGLPTMDYNIRRLSKDFFNHGANEEVLSLIIHEFAHFFESNHLCENYYKACTNLGAKLSLLALADPNFFAPYIYFLPNPKR